MRFLKIINNQDPLRIPWPIHCFDCYFFSGLGRTTTPMSVYGDKSPQIVPIPWTCTKTASKVVCAFTYFWSPFNKCGTHFKQTFRMVNSLCEMFRILSSDILTTLAMSLTYHPTSTFLIVSGLFVILGRPLLELLSPGVRSFNSAVNFMTLKKQSPLIFIAYLFFSGSIHLKWKFLIAQYLSLYILT